MWFHSVYTCDGDLIMSRCRCDRFSSPWPESQCGAQPLGAPLVRSERWQPTYDPRPTPTPNALTTSSKLPQPTCDLLLRPPSTNPNQTYDFLPTFHNPLTTRSIRPPAYPHDDLYCFLSASWSLLAVIDAALSLGRLFPGLR